MARSTDIFTIQEDPFFVADLIQMSKATNYRRWQFGMVAPHIYGKVLEVGGGIGNFTAELARVAETIVSIEPNIYCYKQLVEKTKALANVSTFNATVEMLDQQAFRVNQFDAVILMNVLEHIQDDKAVLLNLKQYLKPGGRMVLLVPGAPWAFGKIDERLGHYRRYSKTSARHLIAELAMEITDIRYFNFIGVWAWWWNAIISRRESQNDSQIRLFDKYLVPPISRIERLLPPPLGQSLLIVAIKHNP